MDNLGGILGPLAAIGLVATDGTRLGHGLSAVAGILWAVLSPSWAFT